MNNEQIETEMKSLITKFQKLMFIKGLNDSCDKAGGGSYESFKHSTLEELADILPQNGIHFTYFEYPPSSAIVQLLEMFKGNAKSTN